MPNMELEEEVGKILKLHKHLSEKVFKEVGNMLRVNVIIV